MNSIRAIYNFNKQRMTEKLKIYKYSLDGAKKTVIYIHEAPFGNWFADSMNTKREEVGNILSRFHLLKLNEKQDIYFDRYISMFKLSDIVIEGKRKEMLLEQFPCKEDFSRIKEELNDILDELCDMNPLFHIFKSEFFNAETEPFISPLFLLSKPISKEAYSEFIYSLLKFYAFISAAVSGIMNYVEKTRFCYGSTDKTVEGLSNKQKYFIYSNYIELVNVPQKVTSFLPVPRLINESERLPDRGENYTLQELAEHYRNSEIELIEEVDATDIPNLAHYCFLQIIQNDVPLKPCENCGQYFIPESRSDEVYCNRINDNGKTCKQMGYENKVKGDKVLSLYRMAYKTQHAKKQRNRCIPDYEEKVFNVWVDKAKEMRDLAKAGKITLDEFKDWVEENK